MRMVVKAMLMTAEDAGAMMETLYLDLFFLVNLFADLSLLLLTGLFLQLPLKKQKGRLLLGAAVGAAAGCVLVFFPKLSLPVWSLLELVVPAVLMARTAFGRCSLLEMLRRVTVLWMTAALNGGVFVALETAGGVSGALGSSVNRAMGTGVSEHPAEGMAGIWEMTPWTFWRFSLALGAAGGMLCAGTVALKNGMTFRNSLYEVTLYYQGKQRTVRALRDTGNQLYEPYGHQPVHILEQSVCLAFGEPVSEVLYVPFCSVGKEHGILAAVRMDRMEVRQQERLVRVLERPWVAISETPLSARHKYEMLLHGELL